MVLNFFTIFFELFFFFLSIKANFLFEIAFGLFFGFTFLRFRFFLLIIQCVIFAIFPRSSWFTRLSNIFFIIA